MADELAPDLVIPELVIRILQQSNADLAFTTNALVEGLQRSLDDRDKAIRRALEQLDFLLTQPYAPSTHAIDKAIMPLRVYGSLAPWWTDHNEDDLE